MKTQSIILLAVILSFELHAQTGNINSSQLKLDSLKLKEKPSEFYESYVHAGIEYGPFFILSEKYTEYFHSFNGFF